MSTTDNIFPSVTYTIDFDANKIPTSNSTLANLIELSTWFPQLNSANNLNKKNSESFTLYGSEATYFLRLLGKLGGLNKRDVNILDGRTTKTGATVLDINVVAPITITSTNAGFACQAGFKNRSFGTQGVAFATSGVFNSVKYNGADDKIIAAGSSGALAMLAKFNVDGTLDTSFGTNGVVTTDINSSNDDWFDIVVQADGKIVAVGSTDDGGDIQAVVGRYNANGSLDTDFGTSGFVQFSVSANPEVLNAVTLQPDGKIIATGSTGTAGSENVLTVRVTSAGVADSTYGTSGVFSFSIDTAEDIGTGIAFQGSENRIVLSGYTDSGGAQNVFVAGVLTDGSALDTNFGTSGVTETVINTESNANDLVLDSSDNLVVAGWTDNAGTVSPVILRYDPDGTIDGSPVTVANNDAVYNSIEIQPDGNFVAVGTNSTNSSIVVGRHTAAALALDSTFANSGVNEIYIGASAAANAVGIRGSDLDIAVAGVQNSNATVVELCGQSS